MTTYDVQGLLERIYALIDGGVSNPFSAATKNGQAFIGSWSKAALANAGNTNYVIKTHATKGTHLVGIQVIAGAGSSTLEIIENIDLNAVPEGTAITSLNKNRNSATAVQGTHLGDPTIDSEADKVILGTFNVAAGNNFYDYGPLASELMLKDGETYTLRVTNGSGGPANYVIYAQFYEDTA